MFQKKTTIVLGAGASNECKLPTGYELKHAIVSMLDIQFEDGYRQISGDTLLVQSLRILGERSNPQFKDINPYLDAAHQISIAMPQAISIDNFLDVRQEDSMLVLCGKMAIVRSILAAERNSMLFYRDMEGQRGPKYGELEATWFNSIFQLLTENCSVGRLPERLSSITFVVFNYDRCVEHYLFNAFQNYYGISASDAATLLGMIDFFHPYGTVDSLPWQGKLHPAEFGANPNPGMLLDLTGQIKTFCEGTDPESSRIAEIRNRFFMSQIVVWLGFAFHRLNLALLHGEGMRGDNDYDVKYFGTAKGISKSDVDIIKATLCDRHSARWENVFLDDVTCYQLFKDYWRSLALS